MTSTSIYALLCPDTREPRYVGRTVARLEARLAQHLTDSLRRQDDEQPLTPKDAWLLSLYAAGKLPLIEELELIEVPFSEDREGWWIATLRAQGHDLLNIAPTAVPHFASHIGADSVEIEPAECVTTTEAGRLLGVGGARVRQFLRAGRLTSVPVGPVHAIPRADVEKLAKELEEKEPGQVGRPPNLARLEGKEPTE